MSAKQAYVLVVGLIILIPIEAVLKHFLPGLPFGEAVAAQVGLATAILTSKVFNDRGEMKYGIVPKAANWTGTDGTK